MKIIGPVDQSFSQASVSGLPKGPTQTFQLSRGEHRTESVPRGTFYVLVRYGSDPAAYVYSRAVPINLQHNQDQRSIARITLQGANASNNARDAETFFDQVR